jgi:hypothetical protein
LAEGGEKLRRLYTLSSNVRMKKLKLFCREYFAFIFAYPASSKGQLNQPAFAICCKGHFLKAADQDSERPASNVDANWKEP